MMMMFELRIDIFDNSNIILSLYCEPAQLFTLQAQATTPSIYLHTHIVLALTVGFQTFSQGPTYIPEIYSKSLVRAISEVLLMTFS